MKKIMFQHFIVVLFITACSTKDDLHASPEPKNPTDAHPVVKADATYNVLVKGNITYGEGLAHDGQSSSTTPIPLKLDLYEPDNALGNRPVFMFMHGGSFRGGSRKKAEIVAMGNYFASRGWVFLSIDYRASLVLGNIYTGVAPQEWIDESNNNAQMVAMYTAPRDAKAALRWIVANAETYHINTDYITIGGGSAGAITAVGVGVSADEDFRDEMSTTEDPTLLSTNLTATYNIRTIVDFWGSDSVLSVHESVYGHNRFDSNDPELFIIHGTEDKRLVPYSGSLDLIDIYESIGVYAKLAPIEGRAHGPWDATVDGKSLSDLTFDFLVERQKLTVEN